MSEKIIKFLILVPWVVVAIFLLPIVFLGFLTALIVNPFITGYQSFSMVFTKTVFDKKVD